MSKECIHFIGPLCILSGTTVSILTTRLWQHVSTERYLR